MKIKNYTLLIFLLFAVITENLAFNRIDIVNSKTQVDIEEYKGIYKLAPGSPVDSIIVTVKEGKVFAQGGEYPNAELIFKADDEYEEPGLTAIFKFIRIDNKVTQLKVLVQGMELVADKQP